MRVFTFELIGVLSLIIGVFRPANAFITVNEGLQTTKDAVYIGTTTPQVLLNGGTFYSGVIPSVSLKASSNVVVGADNCVIYSTGSMGCTGAITGDGSRLSGITVNGTLSGGIVNVVPLWASTGSLANSYITQASTEGVKVSSNLVVSAGSVTASAFFGDGSHLSGVTASESNTYASSKTFTSDLLVKGNQTMPSGSSMTFSNGSYWTVAPQVFTTNWVWLSSADTTGVNSASHTVTLTDFVVATSSVQFWLRYDCVMSTGMLLFNFNGDASANYNYGAGAQNPSGTNSFDGGLTDRAMDLSPQGNTSSGFLAGTELTGNIFFKSARSGNTKIAANWQCVGYRSAYSGSCAGGGVYTGTTTPQSITLRSGTYTTSMTGVFVNSTGYNMNCHTDLFRQGYITQ